MARAGRARHRAGVMLAVAWAAALFGCATPPQTASLRAAWRETPPQTAPARPASVELLAVPFHPQEDYQCGPAALATVLNAAGVAARPDELTPQVYLPGREGSLQVELLAATRRHGLVAYRLAPSLAELLDEVAAGTPVLVLQNLSLPIWPKWHYAVVAGFDRSEEEIVLRSGREARQVLSFSTFERTWARSGRWAMLALPPGRLPANAAEADYVAAAAALEQAGQPAPARIAYSAALARWPGNLAARMGLGNSAYALGDLAGAEAAFRQASQDHPQAWPAFNNLALVLAEQGQREPALLAASEAVRLAGPEDSEARATLAQIRDGAEARNAAP